LKDVATCSDIHENGMKYTRENITKRYADKLAMAQRANKKKQISAINAKIKNVRNDWSHKVTTELVNNASYIAVGDVSSTKLAKTKFAKSVLDAGWGRFRSQLKYKAIALAVTYKETNESWSTVTCSACGDKTGPRGLGAVGVREWTCASCGAEHERDINSACNILKTSLSL
jgi:IS605 OrfB family transposase